MWRAGVVVLLCMALSVRAGLVAAQALENPVLGRADALLRANEPQKAWELLLPLEGRYAGQPDFDYLLGIAALESGRANRATFILERVVIVNPGHMAARLEMGRAYFVLRDFERAEREFVYVLKSSPPAEIRAVATGYLSKMRERPLSEALDFSGYVEAAFGRDTNVAAASTQGSIYIPALGIDFLPDPVFQRRPDDFSSLGAGLEVGRALRGDLELVAGLDYRQRWHADVDNFDSRALDLSLALVHDRSARDRLIYSARLIDYALDNAGYRRMHSLAVQWSRGLGPQTRVAFSTQAHRLRYLAEENAVSSSDLLLATASVTHVLHEASRTVGSSGISLGHDNAVAGRADGDRRLLGMSFGVQRRLGGKLDGFVRYAVLFSDYATQNADFGQTRRDRQHDAVLGLAWEFAPGWSLRPQIGRTSNRSNLSMNDYSRTETSMALRRVWD